MCALGMTAQDCWRVALKPNISSKEHFPSYSPDRQAFSVARALEDVSLGGLGNPVNTFLLVRPVFVDPLSNSVL